MDELIKIFCNVDDKLNVVGRESALGYFCKVFIPEWDKQLIADDSKKRNREG